MNPVWEGHLPSREPCIGRGHWLMLSSEGQAAAGLGLAIDLRHIHVLQRLDSWTWSALCLTIFSNDSC